MSFLPVGSSNRCIDVALCFVKHPQESSARYGTAIAAGPIGPKISWAASFLKLANGKTRIEFHDTNWRSYGFGQYWIWIARSASYSFREAHDSAGSGAFVWIWSSKGRQPDWSEHWLANFNSNAASGSSPWLRHGRVVVWWSSWSSFAIGSRSAGLGFGSPSAPWEIGESG